ncbi:MAG: RluA family pseudouridine synthase [Bacteroidetes bacterium]|nr:RluA family pseudouridine synthase [Bacteroidota bacterium]
MAKRADISDWILKETADYVFVNKPPFFPSVPERGKYTNIPVLELARKVWPDAILCHRLDRETSGVLLIAKNPEAYRHASIQFENRKVNKVYHAIVNGKIQFDNLEVNLPINTDDLKHIRIDKLQGKAATTYFQTLEVFRHFTLLECKPVTGRLHQIRVHLASQNAQISGDVLYGSQVPMLSEIKRKMSGEDTPLIQRFALHAYSLEFEQINGERIMVNALYNKDFEVFIKLLRKYDL